MNRTAIEYVINPDGTQGFNWAIVTGCLHQCRDLYCYNTMKKTSPLNRFFKKNRERETGELHFALPDEGLWPYGFDPTYYPYRLEEPMARKKPSTIFVVNGGDLFGKWIPDEVINCVLTVIRQCPQHTFILLTKNPSRYIDLELPDNVWVGMTVTDLDPLASVITMNAVNAKVRWVSFEPLHGDTLGLDFRGIDWVVVGAESGPRNEQMKPKRQWVEIIVKTAQAQKIPIWMKNNLAPASFKKEELIQELPNVR